MSYHFIFTEWFDRNLKFLRKHNPTLRADFEAFLRNFEAEAHPIIPGTGGARKARMKAKTRKQQPPGDDYLREVAFATAYRTIELSDYRTT